MTWKEDLIKQRDNYKPEFGKPLKEPIIQFCDKCGRKVIMPKGEIYGQETENFCEDCVKGRLDFLASLNRQGLGE